jgi:hypothetical protein
MSRLCVATLFAASVTIALPTTTWAAPFLLTANAEAQLETWLGQGDVTFSILFEKASDPLHDDAADFHAASDGQGASFTLFEAFVGAERFVIGGYNPQSWSSGGGFTITPTDAERTAFIYNLTTGVRMNQRPAAEATSTDDFGQYQAQNEPAYGPTFGFGSDIWVGEDLSSGYALQYSYGVGTPCEWGGPNIVGVTYAIEPCMTLNPNLGDFQFTSVGALEVYTLDPDGTPLAQAPEPATLSLLGLGLAAAGWQLRRRRSTGARASRAL